MNISNTAGNQQKFNINFFLYLRPAVSAPISNPSKLAQRKARFEKKKKSGPKYKPKKAKSVFNDQPEFQFGQRSNVQVVGTCTDLEKPYFRLKTV